MKEINLYIKEKQTCRLLGSLVVPLFLLKTISEIQPNVELRCWLYLAQNKRI